MYTECGWESLSLRRKNQKLCLMYRVKNDMVPSYILDLFPLQRNQEQNYPLRNNENFSLSITTCMTAMFKKVLYPISNSIMEFTGHRS